MSERTTIGEFGVCKISKEGNRRRRSHPDDSTHSSSVSSSGSSTVSSSGSSASRTHEIKSRTDE
jgi:hypothetical protein